MNKKIVSEIAIGAVLIIALVIGGLFYLQSYGQNKIAESSPLQNQAKQNLENQKASSQEVQKQDMNKESIAIEKSEVNTKYGYSKSLELIKGEQGLNLVDIAVLKSSSSDYDEYKNKIMYSFYSKAKAITTSYDYTNGSVTIFEQKDVANNPFVDVIPDEIINLGYEGANILLEKNPDYILYKEKFPELFSNENVGVVKDTKYGWEWRFSFLSKSQPLQMIVFSVNQDSGKVLILRKNKVD